VRHEGASNASGREARQGLLRVGPDLLSWSLYVE
jgi:hypothetical protein